MRVHAWVGPVVVAAALGAGCATVETELAKLPEAPKGVRVYPPRVCLLVDAAEKKSVLAYLPDYRRAYDVKPLTIFAKHDFKVELEEGQLKTLQSNQDTTAFLTFMKDAGTLAAKAAGVGLSSQVISGTFGFDTGVHCMKDDGTFAPVR